MINLILKGKRGISLIEMLVVVAIIVVLLIVVIPQFSSIKKVQLLNNAAQDIASALNKAKSQTLSSLNGYSYGVRFGTQEIKIFRGTTYVSDPVNNQTINIDPPLYLTYSLIGNGCSTDLYFNRLTGMPSCYGSATVRLTGESQTKIISISGLGAININD